MKNFFSKLPPKRLIIYFVLLGFFPAVFIGLHFAAKRKEWNAVSEHLIKLQTLSTNAARRQALNRAVRILYADSEQYYLENQVEKLTFLKKEKEALEHLLNNPSFTGNEAAEKRYAFLNSNTNHLEWIQENVQAFEHIQQSDLHLAHSIEIDAQDLKEILSRLESQRKGKPQIFITDFKLCRKEMINGNEVFELNMKLLKREFLDEKR